MSIKRLFGVGSKIKPVTADDVEAAQVDPYLEQETEIAKNKLYQELIRLEKQSVVVRKLLASDALDIVAKPGKRS